MCACVCVCVHTHVCMSMYVCVRVCCVCGWVIDNVLWTVQPFKAPRATPCGLLLLHVIVTDEVK